MAVTTFPNPGSERAKLLLDMMCAGGHPLRPNVEQVRTIRTLCTLMHYEGGELPASYSYGIGHIRLHFDNGLQVNVDEKGGLSS